MIKPVEMRRTRAHTTSLRIEDLPPVLQDGPRIIYTGGRPPWYDSSGQMKEAFVIGICGGSGSGKTTTAKRIIKALDFPWVSRLSMDCFYKNLTDEQREAASHNAHNFDSPDALDFEYCTRILKLLKEGKRVHVPIYNFVKHCREKQMKTLYGANLVVFEGILSLATQELRDMIDLKIFVDTDVDVCLSRRLLRDTLDRGRSIDSVLHQYVNYVKPAFDRYIAPTMVYADVIIPAEIDNDPAIDLIVKHVQRELNKRGHRVRNELIMCSPSNTMTCLPHNLYILDQEPLVRYLHTIIRSKETRRDDFIFYSKRLMRILFEYALSLLQYKAKLITTAQDKDYDGMLPEYGTICAITIMRAGKTMEQALLECVEDAALGTILIQTSPCTGEAELYYLRLPDNIVNCNVFVLDATVATGAAAIMAIRILLEHGVPQESITVVSLLMASNGYQSIAYVYPHVKIVTSAVDQKINDCFHIIPGIGNFGDRYYGTE